MKEVILDRNKISIENQTNPVVVAGVSSTCTKEFFLIFGFILLMIGVNSL